MPFQIEKAFLRSYGFASKIYDAMFISAAVIGFGTPLLLANAINPKTSQPILDIASKAALSTMGMCSLAAFTAKAWSDRDQDKLTKAFKACDWQALKHHLKQQEQIHQLDAEMEASAQKVEMVLTRNPWEWGYWAKRAGVEANVPPLSYLTKQQVEQPPTPAPAPIESEYMDFVEPIPDLAKKLADDLTNTLIVGVPGSGKGLLVSNALRHVCDRGDTTVFYVDPKNSPKEEGYFADRVHYRFALPGGILSSRATEVLEWLEKCIAVYEQTEVPTTMKLLVVDELTAIMKKLKSVGSKAVDWFEEKLSTYCASGDSEGIVFWGLGQNAHNTGLGMDGGTKSQLVPIAIIRDKQLNASSGLMKADFIPPDKKLTSDDIKEICNESPVGRAIFHGGLNRWYPLPELPNPSGYNRDARAFTDTKPETSKPPPVVTISDLESAMIEWLQSLEVLPTPPEVRDKWEELSGVRLSDEQLKALLNELGLGT